MPAQERVCEVLLNTRECYTSVRRFRTNCHGCGRPACPQCSEVREWYGHLARICADCAEDYDPPKKRPRHTVHAKRAPREGR